jgi:Flp pilus assembly protein CpaB
MRPFASRRPGAPPTFAGPMVALAVVVSATVIVGVLWGLGLIDFSKLRASEEPSTVGLVPIPTPARLIPAYTKITRDQLWDPRRGRLTYLYLKPNAVTREMLVNLSDIIGRVLEHDKPAGYVFTSGDFLPRGTREGIVAGIPAGKRAMRIATERVDGLYGLHSGDRFDLVATMPIDPSRGEQSFNVGGVYGQQLALQARLSNWQKQATVRVLVQNGVVVEPIMTRQVPFFSNTTQGAVTRMRPVQEIVIAVDPDEVARLTEAIAVEARLSCVPRSGRPDDPVDSATPDLQPVSPFTGPGSQGNAASNRSRQPGADPPFKVVETIMGSKRELTAVPRP